LIYTNPRPSSESIIEYYPQVYNPHKIRDMSLLEKLYYKYFRTPEKKNGRILDVGCGNGNYLKFLRKRGWDCHGTEINNSVISYMINNSGLTIHKGELYDANFEDEYFDLITFWGSLEHMSDPSKVLQKAHSLLKTEGKLIIWLQNIESVEARIFKKYWHHLEVPTHYYQFSPSTLSSILKRTGFRVDRVRYDPISLSLMPSISYVLNSKGIKINLNNLVIKAISAPMDIFLSLVGQSGLITVYATK